MREAIGALRRKKVLFEEENECCVVVHWNGKVKVGMWERVVDLCLYIELKRSERRGKITKIVENKEGKRRCGPHQQIFGRNLLSDVKIRILIFFGW